MSSFGLVARILYAFILQLITSPCALNKIWLRLLEWGAQFDTSDINPNSQAPLENYFVKKKGSFPKKKKYHHPERNENETLEREKLRDL